MPPSHRPNPDDWDDDINNGMRFLKGLAVALAISAVIYLIVWWGVR